MADPDLIWQGLGDSPNPISGNCSDTSNDFCRTQIVRADAVQVVANPDPVRGPPKMFRYEVRFQDGTYTNPQGVTYSDQRACTSMPSRIRANPGDEQWWRWFHLVPESWVGRFPKQDQLTSWPRVGLDGGSGFQFHHGYSDNRTETGSAPLYTGIDDKGPWLKLVDQATSTERQRWTKQPLQRNHAYEWLLHVVHHTDPGRGLVELWIDGEPIVTGFKTYTMYAGTFNYAIVCLYRRFSIGDPSLRWPAGTPLAGKPVYTDGDGARQAQYLGGLCVGKTRDSVMNLYPSTRGTVADPTGTGATTPSAGTPTPAPVPTPPDVDFATAHPRAEAGRLQLVNQRAKLDASLLQFDAAITTLQQQRAEIQKIRDATVTVLNAGPWT